MGQGGRGPREIEERGLALDGARGDAGEGCRRSSNPLNEPAATQKVMLHKFRKSRVMNGGRQVPR